MGSPDRISRRRFLLFGAVGAGGAVVEALFPKRVEAQEGEPDVLLGSVQLPLNNRHPDPIKNRAFAFNIFQGMLRLTTGNAFPFNADQDQILSLSSKGYLRLPPGAKLDFVSEAGPTLRKSEGYVFGANYEGDGLCHLASAMNLAASDRYAVSAGVKIRPIVSHALPIPLSEGRYFPRENAVAILSGDPSQNLVIENNGPGEISFKFAYDGQRGLLNVDLYLHQAKKSITPVATATPITKMTEAVSTGGLKAGAFEYGKMPEGFTHDIKLEGVRLPDWAVWVPFQLYRRYKEGKGVTKLPVDMIPFLLGLKVSETGPDSGFIGTTNFNKCLLSICKTQGPAAKTIASWVGVEEFLAVVNEYPRGRGVKFVLGTPCSVAGAFGPFQFLPTTAKTEIEGRINWDKAAAFVAELKELGLLKPRVREIKQLNPLNYTDALALAWLHTTTLGMKTDGTNFNKWNNSAVQKNKVVKYYATVKAGLDRLLRDAIQ